MPTKKYPITNSEGKRRRSTKATPNVETPVNPFDTETILKDAEKRKTAQNTSPNIGQSVANGINTVAEPLKATVNGVKAVGQALKGNSPIGTESHKQVLDKATQIATQYGVELTKLDSHMSASSDGIDENLGEGKSLKLANEQKLKIHRQNNALDVRLERIKQKRKVVSLASEELRLVGDLVDHATVGVEVASKVINHQIAVTNFETNQSRLIETEELRTQQHIRTDGVIALTQGVRQEWQLKFEKQARSNEQLLLQIEDADKRNQQTRLQIEAFLLSD